MLAEYSIYGGNEILRCDTDANLDRQNSDLATEYASDHMLRGLRRQFVQD
jgi:hypothetical protein